MRLPVIAFLTVGALGCSSSSGSGAQATQDAGTGGDDGSGADADSAVTPTWTAFASRGGDSRWGVPVAYESSGGRFVAFGGSEVSGVVGMPAAPGTYALQPTDGTWAQLTDTSEPSPRYCGCATYLPDQHQVLLVGGQAGNGPLPPGAWTLDVATGAWTAVTGTLPTGTIGCAAAYVPDLGRAFVFGGLGLTGMLSVTWAYDPAKATFSVVPVTGAPSARADAIAAYDPGEGGRMLLFAGTSDEVDDKGHDDDLWSFDGTAWTELHPTGGPPSVRRVPAGGFDPARRRWIVFGGTIETEDRGDLWLLDVPSLTWTQLQATGGPSPRGFASAGYSPATDSYFVVGGLHQPEGTMLTDGWKLTL